MPDYDATAVDAAAGPGATAVLHGMLSTLTEVLGGLERRLAGMEAAMEGMRVDTLAERVGRLEEHLDDRLAEVAGGRERTAEALAAIGSGVGHLAARLDQLAEVEDQEPEPDRIGPLAERVDRLAAAVEALARRIDSLPAPEPVDLTPVLERIDALPVPREPEPVDLTPVLDGLASMPVPEPVDLTPVLQRIDALPVPREPEPVDLTPVLARLGEVAASVDAVGFGLAGLTDALQAAGDNEEPDVAGIVADEAERIRATVAGLGRALAAVQAEAAALAQRPVEVNVDVDLDRIVALLDAHAVAVREEFARLDILVRGQVAEVAGRTGSITEVIGRLDGRLHEVVDGVRALQRRADEPVRLTALAGE